MLVLFNGVKYNACWLVQFNEAAAYKTGFKEFAGNANDTLLECQRIKVIARPKCSVASNIIEEILNVVGEFHQHSKILEEVVVEV